MKIMMVITGLSMGGAEKVVVSLSEAIASRGCDVLIVYLTGEAVVLPKNPKINLMNLGIQSKMGAFNALIKLRKLVVSFQPDVVHSHMFHANILARLLRMVIPIRRLICTAHSNNEGNKLRMLVYRLTDALADISTNVSSSAVEDFIKKKATKSGRMIHIHNGIDSNLFKFNPKERLNQRQALSIEANCKMLLAVGRLDEAKDYPNLLYALSKLPKSVKHYKLYIVGDGPLREELEELAIQLNLLDHILFLGIRQNVADLMSAADVFVLSSAWEGFGLVVAEAMACERVVVATDCGGVKEVVGETGLLVRPQDSTSLAQVLHTALNLSDIQCATLGHTARLRVIDLFTLEVAISKWLRLYSAER